MHFCSTMIFDERRYEKIIISPVLIILVSYASSKANLVCLCQYNIEGMSFTLNSLFNSIYRSIQIVYFVFALIIFLIGGMTNYTCLLTFYRPNLRQSSMGIDNSILSIIEEYSLFSLLVKIILIF